VSPNRAAAAPAPSTHLALVVELVRHHVDVPESVEQPDHPDFAQIYGSNESITPRLARRLWTAALFCADTWRLADDPGVLIEDLPPVAWPHAVGAWYQRFVDSFDALADRIARGQIAEDEVTTCTGEEMALHLVIDFAEGEFDSGFDSDAEALDRLPDRGDADHDFERARDLLLRDEDVLMLYDASLDGIDDPDNDLAAAYRTVNLRPSRWFLPFLDTSAS
jgi:hypothetical protein